MFVFRLYSYKKCDSSVVNNWTSIVFSVNLLLQNKEKLGRYFSEQTTIRKNGQLDNGDIITGLKNPIIY